MSGTKPDFDAILDDILKDKTLSELKVIAIDKWDNPIFKRNI